MRKKVVIIDSSSVSVVVETGHTTVTVSLRSLLCVCFFQCTGGLSTYCGMCIISCCGHGHRQSVLVCILVVGLCSYRCNPSSHNATRHNILVHSHTAMTCMCPQALVPSLYLLSALVPSLASRSVRYARIEPESC